MVLFHFGDRMKYTHIIWDFNGTILNDVQTGIDAVNVLLNRYGKKPIESAEQYRKVFGFPVIDYYDSIGLERENFARYARVFSAARHSAVFTFRNRTADAQRTGRST